MQNSCQWKWKCSLLCLHMCVGVWLPHATNGTRIVCYSLFCGYSGCIAHTWEIKRHDVNQWLPACLPQVVCAAATAAAAGDAASAAVVGCNDATRWRCQTTFSKRKSKWASEKSGLLQRAWSCQFHLVSFFLSSICCEIFNFRNVA